MRIEQARIIFAGLNGSTFIGLDTLTNVPLRGGKRNPHKDHVTKRTIGSNVMIFQNRAGSSYDAMVRRRLVAEGKEPESFVLSDRTWGNRIIGTPFVEHGPRHYLEVIFLHAGASTYYLDGTEIAKADIIGLEPHNEARQGGLANKVVIRDYMLDSIVAVRINGLEIQVRR